MCGISGVLDLRKERPVPAGVLTRMSERLAHRGPDDSGAHLDRFLGLGHRRLSVIDVDKGHQPLTNEDGTVWVVYNGEIYNHRDLRRRLETRGHRFATDCDTEVIVHSYEEHGRECVSAFNGMFAFALWDARNERLLLTRDRIGIKPLYYAIADGWLVFGSEIKAILEHPAVRSTIELTSIPEVLLCTSLLDSRTMFHAIRSVAPGSTVVVEGGAVREQRYWSMERDSLPYDGRPFEDCREALANLLDDSVRWQVVSDVPFGTLLSGGLDSSLVTALAARHVAGRLRTFSMDYGDNRSLRREGTDTDFARQVSAAYDTVHTELVFRPQDYFDVLSTVTWHVEKPVDLTSPSLFLLYRGVKPTVTVVTSGEGADELFAGYDFFLDRWRSTRPTEFPWAPHLDEISTLLDPGLQAETGCNERIRDTLAVDLDALHTPDLVNQQLFLFLKYYMVEMLERLDKTSMAWGVESRVPFLDHRIVEQTLNLPSRFKSADGEDKILLKSLGACLLPPEVIQRKKRPVPIPVDPKTLFVQRNEANSLVQSSGSRIGHYFDKRNVDAFFRKKDGFAATDDLALYRTSHALIALDAWHRAFGVSS